MNAKLTGAAGRSGDPPAPAGVGDAVAPHARGSLTVRERLDILLDPGSFEEGSQGSAVGDQGLVLGRGSVSGRPVFVFGSDRAIAGGSMSAEEAAAIAALQAAALDAGAPLVGLFDGGGLRRSAGIAGLASYGAMLRAHAEAAGRIPQIAVVAGPCTGFDALRVGLCDLVVIVRDNGTLNLTDPAVAKAVNNETVSAADCGGARLHSEATGIADMVCAHDVEALLQVRHLLDLLPSSAGAGAPNWPAPAAIADDPVLDRLAAADDDRPRDVGLLVRRLVDEGDFFSVGSEFALNLVVGFGRLAGRVVGVVANQPMVLAGVLDATAARKVARFVRLCDRFGIPLITLVDAPGFLPGADSERAGIVAHVADLIAAYATATVPRLAVVTGCAFGGAYLALSAKCVGGDRAYLWPQGSVELDGSGAGKADGDSTVVTLTADRERLPMSAPALEGVVDRMIHPRETRRVLAHDLAVLCAGAASPS